MWIKTAVLAVSLLLGTGDHAWRPDDIPWEPAAAEGTRFALLEGDRTRQGAPFSYAFLIPAGLWDAPHAHSSTARVFVARGTLRLGYGSIMDRAKTRSFPAGSYVIVPAGVVHYDGADTETVILGMATGPWRTDYVDRSARPSAGTPGDAP
jgi:hypothetical protein